MQLHELVTLARHRDLLLAWTSRNVRARYQQSVLGGLWAVTQPAATAAILTVVFAFIIPIDTGEVPYILFSYTALVPWTLFSGAILDMVDSLVINMNLVTRVYFPREILPIAALLTRVFDYCIAFAVLLLLLVYYERPLLTLSWQYIPLVLASQIALALGVGLTGAALNVFRRDIRHLFILGMQLWFYLTPIIYPTELVPDRLRPVLLLNPMTGIIDAYRAILLQETRPTSALWVSGGVSLLMFVGGYWFFKRAESRFADVV